MYLVEKGADVNAANKYGKTPLIYACNGGKVEVWIHTYFHEWDNDVHDKLHFVVLWNINKQILEEKLQRIIL